MLFLACVLSKHCFVYNFLHLLKWIWEFGFLTFTICNFLLVFYFSFSPPDFHLKSSHLISHERYHFQYPDHLSIRKIEQQNEITTNNFSFAVKPHSYALLGSVFSDLVCDIHSVHSEMNGSKRSKTTKCHVVYFNFFFITRDVIAYSAISKIIWKSVHEKELNCFSIL